MRPKLRGLHPQGLHPQGLHPQGLHPQGLHPQGLHPQGLHPQRLNLRDLNLRDIHNGSLLLQSKPIMSDKAIPYVSSCGFCGGGLLRLYRCAECGQVVATCDECELTWTDLTKAPEGTDSDATFPTCPTCQEDVDWYYLDMEDIQNRALEDFIEGESE